MVRAPLLLALFLPLLAAPLAAEESPALAADPRIVMGRLENGMRYWLRPHRTPPGKVELMIRFGTGSLNEEESQRGLAHFLEHMAFNGSSNFPPGSVVPFFASLGLRFGHDQNAFTSFDQTTYLLTLPADPEETLKKGLLFFSDVASRLLLTAEEIDKERGVILEEARSRKGVDQRLSEAVLPVLAPYVGARLPIGLEEVIRSAPRERFQSYYAKWYRPDTAAVIACGDFDAGRMEALVREAFSGWKAEGAAPAPADPRIGRFESTRVLVVSDPELPAARAGFSTLAPAAPTRTVADFRADLVSRFARFLLNRRLETAVQEGAAPFQSAALSRDPFPGGWESRDAEATSEPEKWAESLQALVREVRRVHLHGFTDDEAGIARAALLSGAERAAQTEPTMESGRLARRLLRALHQDETPVSAEAALAFTRSLLPGVGAKEAADAIRAEHPLDRVLVVLALPAKEGFRAPTESEAGKVFRDAAAAEVEDVKKAASSASPLEKDPAPGEAKEVVVDAATGVLSANLSSGVRLHVKTMDARKDTVLVRVSIVGGALRETAENRGVSLAAAVALTPGRAATARLSPSQVTDFLTGKKVSVAGGVGDQGFALGLTGAPADLEAGFRLLHAMLTGARVDPRSFEAWKAETKQRIARAAESPQERARDEADRLLTGGDPRLLPLAPADVDRLTVEAAQAWLDDALKSGPIEVAIVGDLPAEEALRLARTYLGSLPARPARNEALEALRAVKVGKGPFAGSVAVPSVEPLAVVILGWRGPTMKEYQDAVRLTVASQVLTARLIREIRENRGLTYSVGCGLRPRRDFPETSALFALFTADPKKAAEALAAARGVMAGLLESPPTDEEMETVRKQMANELSTTVRSPDFWAQTLADLDQRGQTLANVATLEASYTGVTREALMEAARRYFVPERSFEAVAAGGSR